MFENFLSKARLVFADSVLRRRILFVFGGLVLFRALATIPIPGIDAVQLEGFLSSNQLLGLLDIFSGGGLSNLSIVMLGVAPYITASIIMQLLTIMSPKLKEMYQEEGEAGRKKFSQYSRLLTIPLALLQAVGFLLLFEKQGVMPALGLFNFITNVAVVAGGSILLMWVGELITEFGIGNGVSILIFAGIVTRIPSILSQAIFTFDPSQIPLYLAFVAIAVVIVLGVVVVTEAERPIPITYARRVRGMKVYGGISTYLPLRVNQAGVIPIIFALSLLLFPQLVLNFLSSAATGALAALSSVLLGALSNQFVYGALYFVLVFLFTYFYTAVTFDPHSIATNLQKSGAFIPGVRPGETTAQYVGIILTRITLVGALFLGCIAVLPIGMQAATGLQTLTIGGTALLIAVSVILDLVRRIDAQISMREY
ncbi:preprotein translocase subunit SecY [Candidatus Kaiserbacteria bacterium RIFCSPHIGHO2_02_FULL_50_9]|uniref:Protein translocase subunit SecY n=1 Tax=Candidatus Kaiserbacteria bacterium RIFCSPLOWO2_01_FULL_51_21 TaxID=1798508 RepID=A0A1F6ECH7_9BACT|nr:MAG: preprotein translocase subunit SecY [Candidatus Kaiserbacteria bacterium RIFCSPHIGHO2_01_FULL_51_33]OGG63350.1 MAG: preprotein translocase subunit SecY [Candidatus Kaiserbacteria bacterium RIFCSPHIGHO2_02_FULL_50_9]OGG71379.1 MAG: preprotein translocase subunit SecY [Candidatus Kaiserbacteria bacterium RIFCSPLOWO2_01_FULL_51_21]